MFFFLYPALIKSLKISKIRRFVHPSLVAGFQNSIVKSCIELFRPDNKYSLFSAFFSCQVFELESRFVPCAITCNELWQERATLNETGHAEPFTAMPSCAKSYATRTHTASHHATASKSFVLRIMRVIPIDATQQHIRVEVPSKVPFVRNQSSHKAYLF